MGIGLGEEVFGLLLEDPDRAATPAARRRGGSSELAGPMRAAARYPFMPLQSVTVYFVRST
jgi:hypothetical protein